MSNRLVRGSYVKFKGQPYIAVSYDGTKVKLMDAFSNRKLNVLKSNVEVLPYQAKEVEFNGSKYLVTLKKHIISLVTLRNMQWSANDAMRLGILLTANMEA